MAQSSYCKQCHTSLFQSEPHADKQKRIDLLRASLDVPISVNRLYGTRTGGGKYLTEEARTWRETALLILQSQHTWKDRAALEKARHDQSMLSCQIQAFLPLNKQGKLNKRDIDNLAKLTLDTMVLVTGIDDAQIYDLHISKRPLQPKQAAYILVALEALEAV